MNDTRARPSRVHARSTGVALLHSISAAACSRLCRASSRAGGSSSSCSRPDLGAQAGEVAGVLTLAEQRQCPLRERHRGRDVAAPGLHGAGVPVGRGSRLRRPEGLGAGDGLATHAYGVGGVAALEVRRGDGDRELDGLVAGVEPGLLDAGHHALAALDGAAQVAGLAVDAAQRDAGLDLRHPVGRPVLDQRLELEDRVVLAVGGLQRPGVEQPRALTQAERAGGRQAFESRREVPLGVLGLAGLQRQLGIVERQPDLVDLATVGLPEQRLHRDLEAQREGLERRRGGPSVPALDAGEIGDGHDVAGHLALGEAAGLAC